MPFADEAGPIVVATYSDAWPAEFLLLAETLRRLELGTSGQIEHVGSTSVPGLPAKDVIDVQIRLAEIDANDVRSRFASIGFRWRPDEWNDLEPTRAGPIPKLVFAAPVGSRPCNVHVRTDGTAGAIDAVLFRDFLRAEHDLRHAWGQFKLTVAAALPEADLVGYGRIKQPAWTVLMYAADAWAANAQWSTTPLLPWPAG